ASSRAAWPRGRASRSRERTPRCPPASRTQRRRASRSPRTTRRGSRRGRRASAVGVGSRGSSGRDRQSLTRSRAYPGPMDRTDVVVVGAGIVGLATARALQRRRPGLRVTVLEKEPEVARHQTSHNSGVVHSGIYYRPGTLRARLCVAGVGLMRRFCEEHGLPYQEVGKVIVATGHDELPRLQELYERGLANGVPGIELVDAARLKEIEPHAAGVRAIYSPKTAIVDFPAVARRLAELFRQD